MFGIVEGHRARDVGLGVQRDGGSSSEDHGSIEVNRPLVYPDPRLAAVHLADREGHGAAVVGDGVDGERGHLVEAALHVGVVHLELLLQRPHELRVVVAGHGAVVGGRRVRSRRAAVVEVDVEAGLGARHVETHFQRFHVLCLGFRGQVS